MSGKVAEASCTTPSPETKAMNSAGQGVYNAEDYQWKDDHLSLDLSRVPTQHPDSPVEATLEELKAAWSKTWSEITQERKWSADHCAEINGKIRQLLRLTSYYAKKKRANYHQRWTSTKVTTTSPRNNVCTQEEAST